MHKVNHHAKDEQVYLARQRTTLSRERSQLSNERTFLSWIRTGLASVGGGVALVRLLTFQTPIHEGVAYVVGVALVILGIAIFILSLFDYSKSSAKLNVQNGFAGSRYFVTIIVFVLIAVSIALLGIIL